MSEHEGQELPGVSIAHDDAGVEIPRATYRLQLNADFGFARAADIVPYLAALGISHVYCSPYLKARSGSRHGYDIVDHGRLDPEIGTTESFETFYVALRRHGMGQLLDIVPNHMAVGSDNVWWLDVLENGPASERADYFDIDWQPLKDELRGKVLLPILGDHYGNVLDRRELSLGFDASAGRFAVEYFEHRCPLDPSTYPLVLEGGLDALRARMRADDPAVLTFESLLTAFRNLPARNDTSEQGRTERSRDKALHSARLARLVQAHGDIASYIDECLAAINDETDCRAEERQLHMLLEAQAYRLAYWRVASEAINYRRFFDINELASLRMENSAVFNATHALILELIATGKIQGLRIDHPDGLYDPAGYFRRLQAHAARALGKPVTGDRAFYVVVEKILAEHEALREDWPVHGATGYEFASLVGRLFVDPEGAKAIESRYREFVDEPTSYAEILYRSKRFIIQTALASELNVLAAELDRIAEADPHTRDFGLGGLRAALREIVAHFPVYRTYVAGWSIAATDKRFFEQAIARAVRRSSAADASVFDFLRTVLLMEVEDERSAEYRAQIARFVMRFQQYTAPVAAKGMEDTAFYRYSALPAVNEVGGSPEAPSVSLASFHERNATRSRAWPHEMLSSSTHDSKRSEDVRARLEALTECPDAWAARVAAWASTNADLKSDVDGARVPDPATEWLLYQTLLGTWPFEQGAEGDEVFVGRIRDYMLKAVREAKSHTSWVNPNAGYESALSSFVDGIMRRRRFLDDFLPFQARIARLGALNSIVQLVLKLTSPGVPDIYRGNELWTFDLVDPDNRREIDFERRRALLETVTDGFERSGGELLGELVHGIEDGRLKLYLTWRCLALRREHETVFRDGDYTPVPVSGPWADRVCAFRRSAGGRSMIVATLRRFASMGRETAVAWPPDALDPDTRLELGRGEAELLEQLAARRLEARVQRGSRTVSIDTLFRALPAAVLVDAL